MAWNLPRLPGCSAGVRAISARATKASGFCHKRFCHFLVVCVECSGENVEGSWDFADCSGFPLCPRAQDGFSALNAAWRSQPSRQVGDAGRSRSRKPAPSGFTPERPGAREIRGSASLLQQLSTLSCSPYTAYRILCIVHGLRYTVTIYGFRTPQLCCACHSRAPERVDKRAKFGRTTHSYTPSKILSKKWLHVGA